jgi:cytochrome c-type biogenesis protein CcmH/NrfG
MPDLGELLLLVLLGAIVAAFIATPYVRRRVGPPAPASTGADEVERLAIRHRVALDAIRDVDADWRAGSLDDGAHAEQRELAERHAARTLAALEAARAASGLAVAPGDPAVGPASSPVPARRIAAAAVAVVAIVLAGFLVPPPFSLTNPTQTNQALADQQAQETARQATIKQLLDQLTANPRDAETLSKLADAYLQGGSADDLSRAGTVLLALISLDPTDVSAYQRLITAYVNVGDWTDAGSATDAYAKVAPDSADIPFFRGIIALRGANDAATAATQFRAFLAAAPDDPRATMIRALLSEAESAAPRPSASPSG